MAGFPWDAARRPTAAAAGHRCEICGGRGKRWPVECHEMWVYEKGGDHWVQRLVRLIALCPACHKVKHWGRSMILEDQGDLERGSTMAHLCRVNDWDFTTAGDHLTRAVGEWRERSSHPWDLDLRTASGYGAGPDVARIIPADERIIYLPDGDQ